MYWRRRHTSKEQPAAGPVRARLVTLALLLTLAACGGVGGSGSSGLTERAAIRVAQTDLTCAPSGSVNYCPTDETDVLPTGEEVFTPIGDTTVVECFEVGEFDILCEYVLTFDPVGFGEQTNFLIATRPFDTDDAWLVGPETDLYEDEDDPLATNEIPFDPFDFDDDKLQMAFVPVTADMDTSVQNVDHLEELGGELVFAAPPVETVYLELPDEDVAIEMALAQNNCVDAGVMFVCPTGQRFPPTIIEPSFGIPLFFFESEVTVVESEPFACLVDPGGDTCSFLLRYRIEGLIELTHQAATRVVMDGEEPGPWRLSQEVVDWEDPESVRFVEIPVTVELPPGTPTDDPGFRLPVQIAEMPDPFNFEPGPTVDILALQVGFEIFVTDVVELKIVAP